MGSDRQTAPATDAPARAECARVLRSRAEQLLPSLPLADVGALSPKAVQELVHELSVHQIELEIQNEELRRAQAAQEASAARYFELYDLAPVGYVSLDAAGLICEANLLAATLLGFPRKILIGQPLHRMIVLDDQDKFYLQRRRLDASGEPQTLELRLLRRDTPPFWVRLEMCATRDRETGATACRIAISDVTERKEAEVAMRDSEQRYRAVFEASADALVTLAPPDWHFTACNQAAVAIFGAAGKKDFQRMGVAELSPPFQPDGEPSWDKLQRLLDQAMEQGSLSFEWLHKKANGETFSAITTLVRLNVSSEPLVSATIRDVSGQQVAEAQLRKLALAVEQTQQVVIVTDLGARIEYVNEAFARTSGYTSDEVLGKNVNMLAGGATPAATTRSLWEAITAGRVWKGEFANRRKNGETYIDFAHIAPVRQPDGRTTHYVSVHEDITEKKRNAEELTRYRTQLEALVERRTHELAAATSAAEAANRAKGTFLANMSHEIRTPLNGVLGMAQVGLRHSPGTRFHETFARILDAGRILLGVIDDILDFSRIEAGKLRIESVPVELGALIEETAGLLRDQARAKGIALDIDTRLDLPANVQSDPLRLREILANLLSNAIKFTERGLVAVTTRRDGDQLILRVRDAGIGMTPELVARLFTPFEQADRSSTRTYGGSGLGLVITKRLVELMGGSIAATSIPGAGSVFEVRLPYREAQAAAARAAPALGGTAAPQPRLAGISVLGVEDNRLNQLVLNDLLASEGAKVTVVGDGCAAVERVRDDGAGTYDVVLMDLQMPLMDGYEATRLVQEQYPHLPIIGQTAHAFADERDKCLAAGMVDYIAKPFEWDELVAMVLRHAHK